jgi:hypothetical protein
MASTIVPARGAWERFEIHNATCRARKQGLACSTCSTLAEICDRAARRVQAAA